MAHGLLLLRSSSIYLAYAIRSFQRFVQDSTIEVVGLS
jgi:hypothetical protein